MISDNPTWMERLIAELDTLRQHVAGMDGLVDELRAMGELTEADLAGVAKRLQPGGGDLVRGTPIYAVHHRDWSPCVFRGDQFEEAAAACAERGTEYTVSLYLDRTQGEGED